MASPRIGFTLGPVFLLGAACAAPPPAAPAASPAEARSTPSSAPADKPHGLTADDVDKLARRELPPRPKRALPSGPLSGEVEAVDTPAVTQEENVFHVAFSMGTDSKVECFIYPDTIDVGSVMTNLVRKVITKDLTPMRVSPTDVVPVGDDVAVFVEAAYTAHRDGGDLVGTLKLMALSSLSAPMMCLHDEMGYSGTFQRVTTGLASTLKASGALKVTPKYVTVAIERIDGHPVGFMKDIEIVGEDGSIVFASISSSLIPRSAVELSSEDGGETQKWDGKGGIVEMHTMRSHGGDVGEDVTIKRVGARDYSYEGTHQGKKVSGKFKTKNPKGLRAEAEGHAAVKDMVGSKPEKSEIRIEKYWPDLDPTGPTEMVLRLVSRADRKVAEILGKNEMNVTVDDQGMPAKGEIALGGAKMTFERVVLRGRP